jgi:hypothetical protein
MALLHSCAAENNENGFYKYMFTIKQILFVGQVEKNNIQHCPHLKPISNAWDREKYV